MSTELPPDSKRFLEQLVADGRFSNPQQALDRAVDLLREVVETTDDLREGLASIERGQGTLLDKAARTAQGQARYP